MIILINSFVMLNRYFAWYWEDLPNDENAVIVDTRTENFGFYSVYHSTTTKEFRTTIFLAVLVVALFCRLILMLQLTKGFGPTLRIIFTMVSDMMKFLFIWAIVIVMLASCASILFGDKEDYV